MSSPTGVGFPGQPSAITPEALTDREAPIEDLATAVTRATSPVGEQFVPSQWSTFALVEEQKRPPRVIILPPPESRRDAALRQLQGLAPETDFECPKEILGYGYALYTREPKEETLETLEETFLETLRQLIDAPWGIHEIIRDYVGPKEEKETFLGTLRQLITAPRGIHEIIRNYVYAKLPLNLQTSFEEWCDYLKLDKSAKEILAKKLNRLNKCLLNKGSAKDKTSARGVQHILEKMYIKITRMRNSLDEKSPKEKARLKEILKKSMRNMINIFINPAPIDGANMSFAILCEIEAEAEFDRNPEIPFFKPLAGTALIEYSLELTMEHERTEIVDRIPTPTEQNEKQKINLIYEALGIETSPDFLFSPTPSFPCSSPEEFLDCYDPLECLQTSKESKFFREALLDWAIKYYNLNQYEMIEGQRVYDPLTRALCKNPGELETKGGIGAIGIELTDEAWLFLLEVTGIIQRTHDKNTHDR